MRNYVLPFVALTGLATGIGGLLGAEPLLEAYAGVLLAMGVAASALIAVRKTYWSREPWSTEPDQPQPLDLGQWASLKVVMAWFDAFKTTYVVRPGLYYTGDSYDIDTPLLVTSNYLMTVWVVARAVRGRSVRLLVVDTDGINVWCAAGKGRFGNAAILEQVERYDRGVLAKGKWVKLILPKLGLAGVDIKGLREHKVHGMIGPVRADDIGAFLDAPKLRDQVVDQMVFDLRARTFTWLPGMIQLLTYTSAIVLVLVILHLWTGFTAPFGMLVIAAVIATAYPILFPWIPGKRFAVKGLWLAGAVIAGLVLSVLFGQLEPRQLAAAVFFTLGGALFMGLSYTGNSAVSNYSRVRKETAAFLPAAVVFFLLAAVTWLATEVWT